MHFPDDPPDGEPHGATLAVSTEALRRQANEAQAKPCVGCGSALCGHEALLNVVLGSRAQARCRTCLAKEHGDSPAALAERALQWIVRRDCYRHVWHLAGEAEQGARADRPVCTFGDAAPAAATAPADTVGTAAADTRPTATADHDAGQLGCGELVMQLRFRMLELQPGDVLHVTAHDAAAPIDLPAWCRLTGHTMLHYRHPEYWIRRKEHR